MPAKLKPLADQVIVITGASSGIGLTTARKAAKAGAAVVLVARNEQALQAVAEEINALGGRAHAVAADVGDAEAVEAAARAAIARFGGFDTWVNVAGVGLYGDLAKVSLADHEQLFRTNYFGVVHGSLEAVRHLKDKRDGGAVINVGSVLSDVAVPLLGAYSASKHAVKGFTDALRTELIRDGAPVSVTLVKPSSISSPFTDHARNYMDAAPKVPPPIYAPEVVADSILYAATHPVRQTTVGAGGRQMALLGAAAPKLADRVYAAVMPRLAKRKGDKPTRDNLHEAGVDGRARTDAYGGRKFSVYSSAQRHPGLTFGLGALALIGAAAYLGRGPIARGARPMAARLARPMLARAAFRRPASAMRLASRHPREALRLARALR